jgi:hypothetical protein
MKQMTDELNSLPVMRYEISFWERVQLKMDEVSEASTSGCMWDGAFECMALLVLIMLHVSGNDTGLPVSIYRTLESWTVKVTSWMGHSSADTHSCPPTYKNVTDSLALDQTSEHSLAGTSSLQVLFPEQGEQDPESLSLSLHHSMDDQGLVPVPNVTIPAAIMVASPHADSNPPITSDDNNNDDVSISLESLHSSVSVSQSMIPNSDKDGSSLYLFHSMSHASIGSSSSCVAALQVSLKLRDKLQRQCSSSSADSRPSDSPRRRRRLRREDGPAKSSNDSHPGSGCQTRSRRDEESHSPIVHRGSLPSARASPQKSISRLDSTGSDPLCVGNMDTCRASPHRSPKRSPQRRSHLPQAMGPSDEVILQRLQRHAQLPL